MKALFLALAALALIGCASPGNGPVETTTPPAAAIPASDPALATVAPADETESWDDVICRKQRVTGSRMMRNVCNTRWEWARMEGAAVETMRDIGSKPIPIQ
jgi:hypothetical protein